MIRYLKIALEDDALKARKMAFISGPRQVGKTTLAKSVLLSEANVFNWDSTRFRRAWNRDPRQSVESRGPGPILLDEIHKDRKWKSKLKGLYDEIGSSTPMIVTGSGKLDVYRRGGDSMLGRYLPYRLHPVSVAESENPVAPEELLHQSAVRYKWSDLLALGGFPEPLLGGHQAKAERWSRLRKDRLIHEDLRDFRGVADLRAFENLCDLLPERVGSLLSVNSLREDVGAAYATVRAWVEVLETLYFSFRIRPYSGKIARSLKAEPKLYLFDILQIPEDRASARAENLAALHLLKACHYWTDCGFGNFEFGFVRDKEKREVDFLVLKNRKPWMLVECKSNAKSPSSTLIYFAKLLKPAHVFQLVTADHDRFYGEHSVRVISYERFFSYFV